ncbi:MAG: HAMP domain-containing protein [Aldersonia sp.]|nr:HAMP domain-containing protein [Aldersonia sp.]
MADAAARVSARIRRAPTPAATLFRRLFLINGTVFTIGTLVLALSPATVSARVRLTEIPVLIIGLAVMLAANAYLLRASLAPLDSLTDVMRRVDPTRRGARVDEHGTGDLTALIESFNAMLDRVEADRAAASAYALTAQEGERQRIARELHDEIGQSLTVALLTLKRVADRAPADIRDDLHNAQETVRASLDDVRGIARRLRPDVLDDLGLRSALHALCSDFTAASGVPVHRNVQHDLPCLSPAAELVCYRIAQEGLTNIARHAHPTRVGVSLRSRNGTVELRITDDGEGGVVESGAGIRGMRERALLVGGTLAVTSTVGAGTEVALSVPVAREQD